jgi:hypothetical protein
MLLINYIGNLDVRKVTGKDWLLLENFGYEDAKHGMIIVPKDTLTDFASIPQVAQIIFPKSDLWDWAAVIHDYLYTEQFLTQQECDEVFYRACIDCGVEEIKAKVMYHQLRIWGWIAYKKHTEEFNLKYNK